MPSPKYRIGRWCVRHIADDRLFIHLKGLYRMGRWLNIDNPKSFQEKLQWIKLNDRKPVYHTMVDKEAMKGYVSQCIGEGHVIPTLACYDSVDEIELGCLPDRFILKNTFDSGSYCLCRDKDRFDLAAAKARLLRGWDKDYYQESREWPYKGLPHRIIAEPLLDDGRGEYLTDYKFYTFNGEPRFFYITSGRGSKAGLSEDFFDIGGTRLELNQKHYSGNPDTPELPCHLAQMADYARRLAQGTLHLRVDFYEVGDVVYCGELTFFDGGGFAEFTPEHWNRKLGDWIVLPTKQKTI